ncbi:MAG: ribbon-helix-helix protein, CopG family [Thermoplasmata archaeon]|nr:ribbon-helix-helix domain-containing protein [Candidatus Thermoplasmatota archaeon]MCK4949670.1 ribbon-helix-helix protein, CopG family [Thermoplasmata archaeon]
MKKDTEKVTIRIPRRYVDALEFLVEADDFPSKSEAIRVAIRDLVYARVELVTEKLEKIQGAEKSINEIKDIRKEYFTR